MFYCSRAAVDEAVCCNVGVAQPYACIIVRYSVEGRIKVDRINMVESAKSLKNYYSVMHDAANIFM